MSKETTAGLPIKERSAEQIRAMLKDFDSEIVAQFVRLAEYAHKESLGLSALAHQSHIPSGTLSQAFGGSYPGDMAAISERIEKFFWRLEQKELYGGLRQFVPTQLAKSLFAVFDKTRIIRRIQVIQSPEQLGKSRAAVEYNEQNNGGRTHYVKLSGGARSGCNEFIWRLAETMGIPYTIKLAEKRIRIRNAMESCDLIIIDEAHLIWSWSARSTAEFFDYLRTDIFDDGARGVVLIATNADMLSGIQKFRKLSGYNVGQLLGRMRNEVMRIDPAEDITTDDIRALVSRYYKPGAETVRKLTAIAQREQLGHFGLLEDIMNEAWTRAKARKRELDDTTVEATAEQILGELKQRKELYQ